MGILKELFTVSFKGKRALGDGVRAPSTDRRDYAIDADGILRYMTDAAGHEHKPAGNPDGGQFTGKGQSMVRNVDFSKRYPAFVTSDEDESLIEAHAGAALKNWRDAAQKHHGLKTTDEKLRNRKHFEKVHDDLKDAFNQARQNHEALAGSTAQADGIVAKYNEKLAQTIDSAPGGAWLRSKAGKLKDRIKERYGENAAKKIVASAVAISWGAFIAGPLVGLPNYIPVSVAMLPAVAIAELHYRLKGKAKDPVDDEKTNYADTGDGKDLSDAEIERLAREFIDDLTVSYAHDSSLDLSELIQRLQWAKLGKNPGDQKATKRLADEITRRTDLKRMIDPHGRLTG